MFGRTGTGDRRGPAFLMEYPGQRQLRELDPEAFGNRLQAINDREILLEFSGSEQPVVAAHP